MKKFYIFLIGLLFAVNSITAQTKKTQASSEFFDLGYGQLLQISPNGKYVGIKNGVWSYDTKSFTDLGECEVLDVNNNGQAAGTCIDPEHTNNGAALIVAGVNRTGQWESLGLGRFTPETIGENTQISSAASISEDGKTVFGTIYTSVSTFYPFAWKQSADGLAWDTVTYKTPDNISGKMMRASANGNIAVGWLDSNFGRQAILWTSPSEYKLLGDGQAESVSPNGKYVIVSGINPILYNVETGVSTPISTSKKGSVVPLGVSDDGIVVGFREIGVMMARIGFVWSEIIGYQDLGDFITTYAPDMNIPEYVNFNAPEMERLEVPISISADGTTIGGWAITNSESVINAFILRLGAPIPQLNRAQDLKAEISNRNQVSLTWTAPKATEGETLTGEYKVYRNGELIATVSNTAYTDLVPSPGYISYTVSALYSGGKESAQTENVVAIVVDNYDLPFTENFNSGSFETNFWSVDLNGRGRFNFLSDFGGLRQGFAGACATYVSSSQNEPEELRTLTSKILDATEVSKLRASYLIKRSDIYPDNANEPDTLFFEVNSNLNENNWQVIDKIILDASSIGWDAKSYDLSSAVAGKLFKFRFRGSTASAYGLVDIDNLSISVGEINAEAPKKIIANKNENTVDLVWQDPSGSYGLTYAQGPASYSIGNEGVPFIAVNRFESEALQTYKDLYLTSISAYINKQNNEPQVETKLSLAVYVDGERVVNQAIESFTPNAWNTFKLNEALPISTSKKLEFGIEVREHDIAEYPLMTDRTEGIAGVSDLFTENVTATNNVVWQSLADWGFPFNWSIIANIREEAAINGVERITDVSGYELYRGDEKISPSLLTKQSYQDDVTGLSGDVCYTVVAYYEFSGYSKESESECLSNLSIIGNAADKVFLYFDKTSGELRVNGEFISAMVFDLNGRKVADTSSSNLNATQFGEGVYIVRIVCADNTIVSKKIIINK